MRAFTTATIPPQHAKEVESSCEAEDAHDSAAVVDTGGSSWKQATTNLAVPHNNTAATTHYVAVPGTSSRLRPANNPPQRATPYSTRHSPTSPPSISYFISRYGSVRYRCCPVLAPPMPPRRSSRSPRHTVC